MLATTQTYEAKGLEPHSRTSSYANGAVSSRLSLLVAQFVEPSVPKPGSRYNDADDDFSAF